MKDEILELEKLRKRVTTDLTYLRDSAYKNVIKTQYSILVNYMVDCHRGHNCYCSKETKQVCKDLSEKLEKEFIFDDLKYTFNKLIWRLQEIEKEKEKEKT